MRINWRNRQIEMFIEKIISLISIERVFLLTTSYNLMKVVSINKLVIKPTMTKNIARVLNRMELLSKGLSDIFLCMEIDLNNKIKLSCKTLVEYSYNVSLEFIIFIICVLLPSSFFATAFAQTSSLVDIFPIDSKPFGLSYEEHVKTYWKLMLSIPVEQNPMEDKTGEKCTFGQEPSNSSIFYLPGNTGGLSTITCKIKAGLGLFIPIITVEASQAEAPRASVDELHKIAKDDQDGVTSLYLKINDKEFPEQELRKYRTHTKEFDVTFPNNALYGASPGPSVAVGDGYYVITKPLSPGSYIIDIKGSLVCLDPECLEPTYTGQVKYNLIAQ
jgi:hypothetical protein